MLETGQGQNKDLQEHKPPFCPLKSPTEQKPRCPLWTVPGKHCAVRIRSS